MTRNFTDVLNLVLLTGGLTLATVTAACGEDPTETETPDNGCPTTGCPTTGCPTTGCPTDTGDSGT